MEQPHPPVLAVQQLNITLDGERKIQDLSFVLHAGERVCLLGASGAGKSLTAAALLGTLAPNAVVDGTISLHGKPLAGIRLQQRGRLPIAAIFQDPFTALNPLATVGQQLTMALRYQRSLSRRQASHCASDMLQTLGLSPRQTLARYPGQLSGGQCQRICTAVALAGHPSLLIADEPTSALDMVSQHQLLEVLRSYHRPHAAPAMLFITHDIVLAAGLCQRALVLSHGRLVEQGPFNQLLQQPKHPYSQRLVAAIQASTCCNSQRLRQAG